MQNLHIKILLATFLGESFSLWLTVNKCYPAPSKHIIKFYFEAWLLTVKKDNPFNIDNNKLISSAGI